MDKGSNICRTCLSEKSEMYSIFTCIELNSNEDTLNFANMLASLSIQIAADDGLPNHICKTCSKILNLTYTFKQQCEKANIWLHEQFIKNPAPTIAQESLADAINETEHASVPVNGSLQIIKNEQDVDQGTIDKLLCKSKLEDKKPLEQNFSSKFTQPINEKIKNNRKFLKFELPDGFEVSESSQDTLVTLYKCTKCNQISKNKIEYYRHQQSHRSYICKLCTRSFRSAHGLSYHLKQHQGLRKFVCTYENCNRSFIIKQGLDKHKTLHNVEKNYLCSRCGKTYSTSDSLSYHLKHHAGERPYLCTHCGKTFKQACHLNTHMWNHTGVKPYLCSTCGKRYTTSHHLKKHISKSCGREKHTPCISSKSKKSQKIENAEQNESNQSSGVLVKAKKLPKQANLEIEENNHPGAEVDYFENKDEIMLVIEEIDIQIP